MRIAYVTTYDSDDPLAWSGLGYRIRTALQQAGADVVPVGPLRHRFGRWFNFKRAMHDRVSRRVYDTDREPLLLRHYAREVSLTLAHTAHDVVFSPGTIPIAELSTRKPIAFWTDATFDGMLGFYPEFSNLSRFSRRYGRAMERKALSNARLALYSSQWAADSALRNYGADATKVNVVPFGANLDTSHSSRDVDSMIARRSHNPVRLLFVGTDWERKRGEFAVEVVTMLNARGVRAHLHTVGSIPPRAADPNVTHHGFISKATEEGRRAFDSLFAAASFLILPSRAECYGVVFAEASSFGVPSLATRVGGVETAVRDGVNGRTFALADGAAAYCDFIQRTVASRATYDALARSSFVEYTTRLSWDQSGARVMSLLRQHCE